MEDDAYQRFVKRFRETTDIPPQTVGPLTPYYKIVTKRLKVMPWPLLVFGGICVVALLYVLLGPSITRFVSVLQRGF